MFLKSRRLFLLWVLIATQLVSEAYTFTSTEGASFDGEFVSVDAAMEIVAIRRSSDQLVCTIPVARFSAIDRDYFEAWIDQKRQDELVGMAPKKVLFIGDVFTTRLKSRLRAALESSPYQDTAFSFVTQGRATLSWYLENSMALTKIASCDWDVVVLQEQSPNAALLGRPSKEFSEAVNIFCKEVQKQGGTTYLMTTWGEKEGNVDNQKLMPSYERMQKLLNDAYMEAGTKHEPTSASDRTCLGKDSRARAVTLQQVVSGRWGAPVQTRFLPCNRDYLPSYL